MYSPFWKKVVSYILVISLFFSYCPALVYADQVADDAEILSQEELAGAGTENQAESKDSAVDTVPSAEIEHEHFAASQIGDDVVDDDVVDFSVYNTDYSPIIVQQPQSVECRIGEFAVLSVSAIAGGGGKLSYQWYVIANSMASVIEGETKDEFYAPTDVAGSTTYYCAVSNTIAENVYTIQSDEATVLISSSEDDVSTEVSNNAEEAYVTITEQPVDVTCGKDESAVLKVAATAPEGAALTYQWYEVSGETATAIEGATEASYTAPTGEVGEKSYYCVVTNTVNKLTYTAQSDTVKVTVRENIEVVTDLKIVAGNYSASNPSGYVDVLDGSFNRNTTEYQNITITDISSGFKVYVALSDEIKAKGLVAYEISYDGVPGTGPADSGYLSNGSDGMCVPFQFNRSSIALGKESVVSVEIGTRSGTKFTVSETYSFHITYIRGLTRLRVMENSKNVLNPNSTTRATSTFLNEYTGKLAAGTEKVSVQVKPEDSSATAYIGGTAFTTTSYVAEISLANYISENGKTVEIPVRLEWPATDSSLPTQTRNYSVKLELVSYTPTITEQPVDVTCGKDESAVLKVAATAPEGAALTYQWYEVSGETATAIEGATEASYTAPTGEVGEKSYYCVVTNTVNKLTYATQSDTVKVSVFHWDVKQPRILAQPHDITCTPNERVSLSAQIEEPEAGYCRYLWYNADSNELILNGNNVFEPNTSEVGVKEYYCVIRWFYGNETYDFKTATAKVTVDAGWNGPNYTPVILQQPKKTTCNKGDTCYLSVDVKAPEDGVLSYQWRTISGQPVEGATEAEFTPPTDAAGIRHYLCEVTNTVNGVAYSIYSSSAYVNVKLTYINTPTIVKNFGTYYKENYKNEVYTDYQKEYEVGELPKSVYLQFEQSDTGVEFRVETYHNTVESFEGAELLEKAVANCGIHGTNEKAKHIWEYHVDLNQEFAIGTHFFYCVVTAYNPKDSSMPPQSLLMGPVAITYKDAPIGFDGDGTAETPYLIKTAEDLVLLQTLVSEGKAFGGRYFKIVNDITLPDDWKPIGCTKDGTNIVNGMSNLNPFSGIIDGKISESKNATISVPAGGLPLIGFVKDAYVKNLNIKGERIEGAGLVNNYTGVNLNGNAVTIENVRLLNGTKTLKSGLVASVGGNGYAHASAGFTVTIRDCVIEEGVVVGYDGTQSGIGSFAGRINGTVENCTSSAAVKGGSYVGGILGGRDNAMSQCVVKNSTFHGTVESSGSYAGGIVGGGYDNSTAPNGACPTILACTVDGTVKGNERVGGIFGGDGFVAQTWDNVVGSISANSFTGKVSGSKYVGAIIGYRDSLNRYDNISANTFSAGCGADRGIGFVKYLDTSYANPTKMNGTIVFNTANGTSGCPAVEGCAWRANHNRTDDPLGKDADKLCKKIGGSSADPICYELTVSGNYKTEYNQGEDLNLNGIKLTATWTNGTTSTLSLGDVTIEGYDKNTVGNQTISLSYGAAVAYITVTVKPVSTKITVSVTIRGDSHHKDPTSNGGPHGLARGGLTTWASESSVEADTAETVWDVLQRVAKKHGITFTADSNNSYGTVYIRAVNGLGEFDNGKNSGWMYTVNGTHPEVGVSAKYLKNGDNIVLHYTDDYDYEEGGNKYGQKPSGGTTTGGGSTGGTTTGGTTGTSMITAADRNKAAAVDKLIEKIGTVTKDSGPAIEAARKAYNDLTPTQKRLVNRLKELTDAEKAYAKLTATAEDQKKAQEVVDKIKKIGNVTKDSKQDIRDARKAYDALTDLQKLLVDNYDVLTAAETKFAMLDTLGKVSEPYISTGEYMEKLGTPSVGAIGGEWMVIGLARSGRTVPGVEDYYQKAVEYVQQSIDPDTGRLHKAKSTDNSRMILALTAIGKDVTNVGGYNLLAGLSDLEFVKYQGNNGPIWALLALDSGNYPVPSGGTTTRQALIDEILSVQTSDGGWAISGDRADSDMTGMALTALAPYYKKDPTVKQAIDKAIARLSEMQDDDGGFSTTYGDGKYIATSESTAQVLTALSALGIDADTDSRFVKNGSSVVDALLRYYVSGGGFKHIMDGEIDGMGTEQAYYALTAYYRFLSGKTNLYDMTDIIDMGGDVVTVEPTVPAATEPAQAAQTNIPWWIIAVCIFGGAGWGVVIGIVLVPKLNKKKD